jgi:hypothetical protein
MDFGASDATLTFASGQEEASIYMDKSLAVHIEGVDDTSNCKVVFDVKVFDPETQ